MRFITEFELKHPYTPTRERDSKEEMQEEMGKMIGKSFGWQERAAAAFTRHTLEIEAFPMDKWIEFKKRFADALPDYDSVSRTKLINALVALEGFHGKPSGDGITKLPDLEYRGPNSHCKACEDEARGIKHIQAQKHTCKR